MKKWNLCDPENWHYAASVFPLLERDELEALSVDIREHGLLNPIIRCEGKILDGRNRMLACRLAQVEPRFKDISAKDATVWALSQNLYRRHLAPAEEAFALYSVEIKSNSELKNIGGKDRERAYRKLAKLKVELAKIVETLPIDAAKQVKQLLGVKKDIKEVSKFEALFYRLNALAPSYSDGTEHVTIQLLEEVCSHPEDAELNSADGVLLKGIGVLLERISKEFAEYAQKLKFTTG
jgi:hypothetical protein